MSIQRDSNKKKNKSAFQKATTLPRLCLHRFIAKGFADGQVAVHGDPHERVDVDAEQRHLQVTD